LADIGGSHPNLDVEEIIDANTPATAYNPMDGVHPKVAQKIMRHSDINLTMQRYTHTLTGQEAEAVFRLPDLTPFQENRNAATGTDGKVLNSIQETPQKLTPTAYPVCNQLSTPVS